jgi:uncharacterized coiled-coil protein SlyX
MLFTLQAKLIAGAVGFAIALSLGAYGMHKWDAAEIARLEVRVASQQALVELQNAKVREWKAEGDRMAQKVAAAEARIPAIEAETAARIKALRDYMPKLQPVVAGPPAVVLPGPAPTPAVEGGTVPCEDVLKWAREQYNVFCLRWQSSPP